MGRVNKMLDGATGASGNSSEILPQAGRDENGASKFIDQTGGTFTAVVEAKVSQDADDDQWTPIILNVNGTLQMNFDNADLDANDSIIVEHRIYPRMRHRYHTAAGATLDSWIVE